MMYSAAVGEQGRSRGADSLSETPDHLVQRELEAVMPQIASLLAESANAQTCSIYVYDENVERTVAAFRHGYPKVHFPSLDDAATWAPRAVPVEAEIIRTRRPIRRVTDEDFEKWPSVVSPFRDEDPQYSDIVVPLLWHGSVYGAVYLGRQSPHEPFSDEEILAIEDLALIAVMSIAYARQYGEERIQRRQIGALLDVANLASLPGSVDQILPDLTRAIRTVTGADVCLLYVLDETAESVLTSYSDGLNRREQWIYATSESYPVDAVPIESRIRRTLRPELITRFDEDLAAGSELVLYAKEVGLKEILIAPIVYRNSMVGIIYSWYRDVERRFTPRDVATVQAIANQAGGVVAQARLFDATVEHIQETETLLRIGQAVLSSDSLDTVLDEIARALEVTVPFDYAFVAMLDADPSSLTVTRNWGRYAGSILHHQLPVDGSLTGWAVSTGEIVNVADTFFDSRTWTFDPAYPPIRSVLIAPLISEHGTLGALFAGRHQAGYFSEREERLMKMLSQHAAVAIERVKSREALKMRARRQTLLATVADRLVAENDPADALPAIAQAACGVLADGVIFGLANRDVRALTWVAAEHRNQELRSQLWELLEAVDIERHQGVWEELLTSSITQITGPDEVMTEAPYLYEFLERAQIRQMLLVPLFQYGQARGLMVLVKTEAATQLDREIEELATVVASRIGDALERQRMSRNRDSLLRASEALNSKMELSQILEVFHQELQLVLPCDQYYLNILKPDSDTREAVLADTPWTIIRDPEAVPAQMGITGTALRTRRPILENNAHLRPDSFYPSETEAAFYRQHGESAMVAPLIVDGRVIGSLFVGRTGANRFTVPEFETFMLFVGLTAAAIDRTRLTEQNRELYRASVEVLAATVDAKDPTTLEHSRNVSRYARFIAIQMGLGNDDIERIELAGLLHDIGKIGIPDRILTKPGPLTGEERALINEHAERGASILRQHPALFEIVPLVRHHHEWFDGRGYPSGLSGDDIPIGASVISVAEAFDTMTTERTYRARRSIDEALEELDRCAGTQFHPEVVQCFVTAIRHDPDIVNAGDVVPESDGTYRVSTSVTLHD